jgi:hypothetical protein
MKPNSIIRFAGVAACAGALHISGASAACTGGTAVRGSFGVVINGAAASSGAELYAGLLTFDGKCDVTGTLTGGNSLSSPTASYSVTGSYQFPTGGFGSLSLNLSGVSNPLAFGFGRVSQGKELIGQQSDGSAQATIDMAKQTGSRFSNTSLTGTSYAVCYNTVGTVGQLYETTSDGTGTGNVSIFGGGNYTETYSVSSNGIYAVTINPPYNQNTGVGVIVNKSQGFAIGSTSGYPTVTCAGKQ